MGFFITVLGRELFPTVKENAKKSPIDLQPFFSERIRDWIQELEKNNTLFGSNVSSNFKLVDTWYEMSTRAFLTRRLFTDIRMSLSNNIQIIWKSIISSECNYADLILESIFSSTESYQSFFQKKPKLEHFFINHEFVDEICKKSKEDNQSNLKKIIEHLSSTVSVNLLDRGILATRFLQEKNISCPSLLPVKDLVDFLATGDIPISTELIARIKKIDKLRADHTQDDKLKYIKKVWNLTEKSPILNKKIGQFFFKGSGTTNGNCLKLYFAKPYERKGFLQLAKFVRHTLNGICFCCFDFFFVVVTSFIILFIILFIIIYYYSFFFF